MQAIAEDIFDPVALSIDENQFIIDHGGKLPAVVARVAMPVGVNPRAVLPVIEALYALDEVQKHDKVPWVGLAAVKARCQLYCDQHAEWDRLKATRGLAFPVAADDGGLGFARPAGDGRGRRRQRPRANLLR